VDVLFLPSPRWLCYSLCTMSMKSLKTVFSIAAAGILIAGCIRFLDLSIARYVKSNILAHVTFSRLTEDMPDLLLPIALGISGIALVAYLVQIRRGIYNAQTRLFLMVASSVPMAYVFKTVLKYCFGRITTRYWMSHPTATQFHFFHGGRIYNGFPSGHMVVFTVLFAALWKYFPQHRRIYAGLLGSLAVALILTGYHFLGDVIAGFFVGIVVYFIDKRSFALLRSEKNGESGV